MNNSYRFDLKHFRYIVHKLSQEEFANKIGVAKGTIGKIESGHAKLTDGILIKIENAFSVDLTRYKEAYKDSIAYEMRDMPAIMPPRIKEETGSGTLLTLLEQQTYKLNETAEKLDQCRIEKEELYREKEDLYKTMIRMQNDHAKQLKLVKAKPGR